MQRYQYDPNKHQRVKNYMVKTCPDCGQDFECPSNWRKTHRCPDCAAVVTKEIASARRETQNQIKSIKPPTACERCGLVTGDLQAHHKMPLIKGGNATLDNVEFLCISCHAKAHRGLLAR